MFRPVMLQIMLELSSTGAFLYRVGGLNVRFSISLHNCHRPSHYVTNQQIYIDKIYLILLFITIYRHVSVASATIFRVSNKNTNTGKEINAQSA